MAEGLDQKNQPLPSPPAPDIAIRTMESDIASVEQSGGQAPTAEVLRSSPAPTLRLEPDIEEEKNESQINVPGYAGPEKAIFSPTGAVDKGEDPSRAKPVGASIPTHEKIKPILIILGVAILIIVFWLVGYFIISPWLFPVSIPSIQ